jgi:hypothetical protein
LWRESGYQQGRTCVHFHAPPSAAPTFEFAMPLKLPHDAPTLLLRKRAFEQYNLSRSDFDIVLHLTDDEFRVEGDLVVVGPVYDSQGLADMIAFLEGRGLVFFDDFFDLSGNWPEWLLMYAMAVREKFTQAPESD